MRKAQKQLAVSGQLTLFDLFPKEELFPLTWNKQPSKSGIIDEEERKSASPLPAYSPMEERTV